LSGGTGVNVFSFDALPSIQFTDLGIDTITDFRAGCDKINLDRAIFTALTTTLTNDSFQVVTTLDQAAINAGLIVYSQGHLFYNANGAAAGYGNGGEFAVLSGSPTISTSDFMVSSLSITQ
jgi:hypothetical protein